MTLWDYLGLSRTILFQSSLGLLETIWDYMGLSGIICDYLEIYLTIWDYLGVSGCKQKQERAIHCYLKLFPYPFFSHMQFLEKLALLKRVSKLFTISALLRVMPKSALNVLFFIFFNFNLVLLQLSHFLLQDSRINTFF